ncbi:MAG: hypothetical protein IT368_18110 [Candidatus Hydrogenedentes bacterium]|nr:hypothetical protein [Candidatus Hydrogenedentota bacterium]
MKIMQFILITLCVVPVSPAQDLAQRFQTPPPRNRILPIVHMLPDSPEQQEQLLDTRVQKGFGGIVTNVSFADYLKSEDRWEDLVHTVQAAKELGLALWLYDERGYPSCKAGGLTLEGHPEWQAEGLLVNDTTSTGGGKVDLAIPPGKVVRVAAFPTKDGSMDLGAAIDLAGHVSDGQLSWEAPEGSWQILAITREFLHTGTHADGNLSDALPYPNLLMPEPTARFIELTHEEYARRLGHDLGQWFIATFTDEPSLMSLFLKRQPWRVIPWAPNLAAAFQERRGYALDPLLPALIADAGPHCAATRYDFWRTVGELVAENYFGQIQSWCREHNTLSGGHLLMEEALLAHVALYGDFFRCIRRLDAPSMDCLTSIPAEVPWYVARLISSAAELEGRSVTMSETSDHSQRYRPEGDTRPVRVVTEDEIRGTCNLQLLNGITTITSYYQFVDIPDDGLVRLNAWVGRCSTMLEGGHQVADVAVLYPVDSVWPRFVPSRRWTEDCPPEAKRIESVFRAAGNTLFEGRRDFTYVDSQTLADGVVDGGVLRHNDLAWRVVVLPAADTLPLAAWKNLAEFWRTGGIVIALSALPENSDKEVPSAEVQGLSEELFGITASDPSSDIARLRPVTVGKSGAGGTAIYLPRGAEALLPVILDGLLDQDVHITPPDGPVRVTHRRIDGHEVYFLVNNSGESWTGAATFRAVGAGEAWDPASGTMSPLSSPEQVPVVLGPYGAMLYRFAEARPPLRKTGGDGALPALETRPLPAVPPTVGHGEFVEGGVTPEAETAWHASARLTKGATDTHLFLSFTYPEPIDLSSDLCIVFDTIVPDTQRTPTAILVIARDVHGNEYLASTGRSLGTPGMQRSYVSRTQFERAGWSPVTADAFDWSAVTDFRIGWGGYLGLEGEIIAFTVAPLQAMSAAAGANSNPA